MRLLFFLFLSINILAQFPNYRVSNSSAHNPEEVTIAINPLNPSILAAGSNLDYFYSSTDNGRTWSQSELTSSSGVWGDPVTLFDASGNLYFVHLSNPYNGYWIDRIVVQKSTDNGTTFNDGTYPPLNPPCNQDKAWIAVDLTNSSFRNNLYLTWTEFDDYGSYDPSDSSRILFSKSTDFAETWSEPIQINDVDGNCVDSDETVEGAVPAVGPNGEIYVAWAGPLGIMFDKSTDGGETWGTDIHVADMPGGWDYPISGFYRANGLPITACDTSSASPYRGNIYVLWTDTRNGETNPDVFFAKSTDSGETWSEPVRVNNDSTNRPQFFAWLTIGQTNGNIYASFYDRRNTEGTATEYWLARSTDGGETWDNYCVTDQSMPNTNNSDFFIGDYTCIAAFNGVVHPIWTEYNIQGITSVWTAIINDEDLTEIENNDTQFNLSEFKLYQNYPNPFNPVTTIEYSIPNVEAKNFSQKQNVQLRIYDVLGREITTLVNKSQSPGRYSVKFDASNLPSGIYFYTLRAGAFVTTKKMILMK